ncbi:MAG TPA: MaoC family dehydratase N-terminal domain-containing protein [Acidimicrobiia bacterium]|nr:MaoC family dehydratase N-terminal domain-containing protein [Acidimicrobiia bacterium]
MNFTVKGSELPPVELVVEPARVRDYVNAVHGTDVELNGMAPATLWFGPTLEGSVDIARYLDIDHAKGLLGETVYEIVRPPKVGEQLTARIAISDMFTKESSKGTNSFAILDVRFLDTSDELVCSQRVTFIERG